MALPGPRWPQNSLVEMKLHERTPVVSHGYGGIPPKQYPASLLLRRGIRLAFIRGLTPAVFCEGG